MHSLTSCCSHNGASQGFTPYQRLPRSRSSSRSHSSSIDAQSNHFVLADAPAASSCSDSNNIDSHNSVGSQLKRSNHNVAAPARSNQNISSPCDLGLQSKCFDRHDAVPAITAVPSFSSLSHIDPIPHTCALVNTSTAQIECEKSFADFNDDVNTVLVKIGIIGDSETGKTSLMAKYGGVEMKNDVKEVAWLQKLCKLRRVNIGLRIWDLGGQSQCATKLTMVCRDAAAIFIMFDLTRRSTLLSVKKWFLRARKCSKVAMFVIVGTKYDGFVQMPHDIQLAIIQEARFYARAMGACLFFSSVTHNINIHKIFKVVVAKLFDLPCNISQNLNLGEPIVEYH